VPHHVAILQAILVTFLWSTSWVLIKIGLNNVHLPALTFAGLRYSIAFLVLLAYGHYTNRLHLLGNLSIRDWSLLGVLGIVFYTITQGTQFLALAYLPSAMFSLMLNFTTVVVALAGIRLLKEYPTRAQWGGIALFLVGVLIYLYPVDFPVEVVIGLLIGITSTLANAGSSILGRYANSETPASPFTVTLLSMGFGAPLLLGAGIILEELPPIPVKGWAIILWMAVVNTALAFTLWNITLHTLSATESSVINNTMLVQIAVLAWIFLGEVISLKEGIGLLVAAAGILIVQVWRRKMPA
jgi:drug/metabolite transporter (DMT)-like permease